MPPDHTHTHTKTKQKDGEESAAAKEQEARRQEQLRQRRREVAGRDVDMTGGMGDYTFGSRDDARRRLLGEDEEEEQSIGVRAARGIVARIGEKWRTTENKGEVFLCVCFIFAFCLG
jgi:hypothetical protein